MQIFYDVLYNLFKSKGYALKNINTNSKEQLDKMISSETIFLVGHSQGATRILEQFYSEKYTQIKGIILFDPEQYVEDNWNQLKIPKILFVNTQEKWHDYSNFQGRIEINDDHYFTNSIKKVFPVLIGVLESRM